MERPILFSTPMVRAIMDGRKTQTRRIIKPQPNEKPTIIYEDSIFLSEHWQKWSFVTNKSEFFGFSPYGKKDDILWVRETWRIRNWSDGDPFGIEYKAGGIKRNVYLDESRCDDYVLECCEDYEKAGIKPDEEGMYRSKECHCRWRPSIFMPKEACRIKLLVKNIRVEKLQEISEADAKAEGVIAVPYVTWETRYSESYAELWDEINGGGSWAANPWVWVVEFERAES